MAERSKPGVFDLLVSSEWFATTNDNEAENKHEDMEAFTDQLLSHVEIPELPILPAETPAVTEPVQASPRQFVQASDQDLQRLMDISQTPNSALFAGFPVKMKNHWLYIGCF